MGIKTIISGHKNPDVDSIMSAYGLAELKHKQGEEHVVAVCPGLLPEKASWLFKKFKVKPPQQRNDVYLRVKDIMLREYNTVYGSKTVYDAVSELRKKNISTIPVIEKDGSFLGILSPVTLITDLLNIGTKSGSSLTGRSIISSVKKIVKLLKAEILSGEVDSTLLTYDVFVAAMSPEFFEKHLLSAHSNNPIVIVGDRPEIHLRVLRNNVKFLIITGNCPVEDMVLELAKAKNTVILRTKFDSGTVIRQLKFSTPIRNVRLNNDVEPLSPNDMVHEIKHKIFSSSVDQVPVCDAQGKLLGIINKRSLSAPSPYRIILVDHNEISQSIPGVEELPIVEVVDHHRIGIKPMSEPIKYTCDVVGSTCSIVASMFRSYGIMPEKNTAALLLAGVVTDTLNFQSPTTTQFDKDIAKWLESICKVSANELADELSRIDSPLATMSAHDALAADRKDYQENGWTFALSQIEESNLTVLHKLKEKLKKDMQKVISSDKLDFYGLLVTDAVRGNSEFIVVGNDFISKSLPYKRHNDGIFIMPGVLSRKKQLLPLILSILTEFPK